MQRCTYGSQNGHMFSGRWRPASLMLVVLFQHCLGLWVMESTDMHQALFVSSCLSASLHFCGTYLKMIFFPPSLFSPIIMDPASHVGIAYSRVIPGFVCLHISLFRLREEIFKCVRTRLCLSKLSTYHSKVI